MPPVETARERCSGRGRPRRRMDPRCPPSGACGVTLKGVRPTSAQRPPWLALREWLDAQGGMAGVVEGLRGPRSGAAHELEEARELLAYWERRARRLPP